MTSPLEVLRRIQWADGNPALQGVVVFYRHRGAPDDTAALAGGDVLRVGRSFLELRDERSRLPSHRILRIEAAGRVVWDRRRDAQPQPRRNASTR